MEKLRIAVDMDDVVADFFPSEVAWYKEKYGYDWAPEDSYGRRLSELADPEHAQMFEDTLHQGQFFGDLPMMEGCQEVMRDLCGRYEVFITTAAMEYPGSFTPKFLWLRKHLPFIAPSHIVFCGDKSVIATDYLIDDNWHHFRRFRGQGILYNAPHNVKITDYPRVNSWDDVRDIFLEGRAADFGVKLIR
jgi:5'(3')-deoxyribonucleotidase